jgi:signal transduction histidine kinase
LTLRRNALRLRRVVDALLDVSQIEGGRMRVSPEATQLGEYTTELLSHFTPLLDRARLRLETHLEVPATPVLIDRGLWERVVLNLVSNAFKFTFAGYVRVSLLLRGDHLMLEVQDSGVGIEASELARIFDRFHRVPNTRARTYEGTGIGLALVKEIVELQGGSIEVESEVDRGTTFRVALPYRPAEGGAQPKRAPEEQEPRHPAYSEEAARWLVEEDSPYGPAPAEDEAPHDDRPLVLVVDDNADMRSYLARILGSRWRVHTAIDGVQALEEIRRARPELVVTDMMMPRLDGLGLVRAIRSDERTRTVPVLVVSARAGDEATVEGLDAGADDYLVKPFSAEELIARARSLLELMRLRREVTEAREEVLALISHDLRAPLSVVRLSTQVLDRHLPPGKVGDVARGRLESIQRAADQMTALVGDLLELSRLESGRLPLVKEAAPADELLRETVEALEPLARERDCWIEIGGQPGLMLVCDPERTRRVVANLLSNAIKFSPPGRPIEVRVSERDDLACVEVLDEGAGVPTHERERIFDRYWRNHEQREGGTGLGLAIAREIVERQGGTIGVDDRPGGGSRFYFRLPSHRG